MRMSDSFSDIEIHGRLESKDSASLPKSFKSAVMWPQPSACWPATCQNSFHRCRRKDRRIVRAVVVSQVVRFAQVSSSAHVGAMGKIVLFTCLLQGFLDVFCRSLSHTLEVSRLWRQAKAACDSPRSTVPRGK